MKTYTVTVRASFGHETTSEVQANSFTKDGDGYLYFYDKVTEEPVATFAPGWLGVTVNR